MYQKSTPIYLVLTGFFSAWMAGCSAPSEELSFEPTLVEGEVEPPETFVDPEGRTWVLRVRQVQYDREARPGPDNSEYQPDFLDLPFEELVAALRPAVLVGSSEYTLSDDDAHEFAAKILGTMENEREESVPASSGEDDDDLSDDPLKFTHIPYSPSNGTKQAKTFGANSWSDVTSSWGTNPYKKVALMNEFQTLLGDGCTAFKLINNHTAVTAAHCVHTGSSFKPRKNIKFGGQDWTGTTCYKPVVPDCWDGDSVQCDYALIVLRGSYGANCDESRYDVGYFGYKTTSGGTNGVHAWVMGFPGTNLPSGWSYGDMAYEYRTDNWVPVFDYNQLRSTMDMEEGMSGGPLAAYHSEMGYQAKGIVGSGATDYNISRVFRSSLIEWFEFFSGY